MKATQVLKRFSDVRSRVMLCALLWITCSLAPILYAGCSECIGADQFIPVHLEYAARNAFGVPEEGSNTIKIADASFTLDNYGHTWVWDRYGGDVKIPISGSKNPIMEVQFGSPLGFYLQTFTLSWGACFKEIRFDGQKLVASTSYGPPGMPALFYADWGPEPRVVLYFIEEFDLPPPIHKIEFILHEEDDNKPGESSQ